MTLMSPADIVELIMRDDFISQLNIGALMLPELHGFLAPPRRDVEQCTDARRLVN